MVLKPLTQSPFAPPQQTPICSFRRIWKPAANLLLRTVDVVVGGWAYVPALIWFALGERARKGDSSSSGSYPLAQVSPASSDGTATMEKDKGEARRSLTASDGDGIVPASTSQETVEEAHLSPASGPATPEVPDEAAYYWTNSSSSGDNGGKAVAGATGGSANRGVSTEPDNNDSVWLAIPCLLPDRSPEAALGGRAVREYLRHDDR